MQLVLLLRHLLPARGRRLLARGCRVGDAKLQLHQPEWEESDPCDSLERINMNTVRWSEIKDQYNDTSSSSIQCDSLLQTFPDSRTDIPIDDKSIVAILGS